MSTKNDEIRLYCMCLGWETIDKGRLCAGKGGTIVTFPVLAFLIKHPRGNVLVDTGIHLGVREDAVKQWGPAYAALNPTVGPDEDIVSQLAKLGMTTDDIDIVVNTHLHLDHAGCNSWFPKARFLVQKDELRFAFWPDKHLAGPYLRADFDHPLNYEMIEGDYDIFEDGTIKLFRTPGHSVGHQSVIVRLKKDGPIVIAGDSCNMMDNLNGLVPPGTTSSSIDGLNALLKLRHLRDDMGAFIIPEHDPDFWATEVKHSPEYYC